MGPELQSKWNEGVRDLFSLMAVGGGLQALAEGAEPAAMGVRYMGDKEAADVAQTRTIPATDELGQPKTIHYTTDEPLTSGTAASTKYKINSTPTYFCRFPLCNVQDNVPPQGPVAPGATQQATSQPIPGASTPVPIKP
jgi:hypothetical protein